MITTPMAMAALAIALLASVGSARASEGVNMPPAQSPTPPGTRASISRLLSRRESSDKCSTDLSQLSCMAICAEVRPTNMMPSWRYPTSAPTRSGICAHKRSAARASGMSAACLLVFRTQPRLRDDCSAAIRPFSRTTTEILRSARVSAAVRPMIPPPIMTTEAAGGKHSGRCHGRNCRGHGQDSVSE